MSKGKLIIAFSLLVVVALAAYAMFTRTDVGVTPGHIKVIATIFPVYDFARAVGGDRINLTMLLTPGLEAHSYEPKPSDVGKLSDASLFIFTLKEMEPWAIDLVNGIERSKSLKVLEAGAGVPVLTADGQGTEGGATSDAKTYDPHVWMDFTNAAFMVRSISSALSEIDPESADYYVDNAEAYCLKLESLDEAMRVAISQCTKKTIIHGGHYAFGYLARRYGLTYVAAQGFSPDSELGPRQISELMKLLRDSGSRFIFYEELVEPRAAQTISDETGASMLMLSAGHNISKKEFEDGVTFIDLMMENLKNLKTGLEYRGK